MARTITSYADCQEYLDQALDHPDGIGISLDTKGMATRMIQRLNTCRKLYRERSREINGIESPNYNTSPWDHFVIKKDPEDDTRVLIKTERMKIKGVTPL